MRSDLCKSAPELQPSVDDDDEVLMHAGRLRPKAGQPSVEVCLRLFVEDEEVYGNRSSAIRDSPDLARKNNSPSLPRSGLVQNITLRFPYVERYIGSTS